MEHDEERPPAQPPQQHRPADPDASAEAPATTEEASGTVMDLLAEHVPLTLLADLAAAEPRSEAILRAEGLPEDAWWVEPREEVAADAADAVGGVAGRRSEDELPVDPDAASDPRPEGRRPA